MNTTLKRLKRLLSASENILRHTDLGHHGEFRLIREEFSAAIRQARAEVTAHDMGLVDEVIAESWDIGWEITAFESLCALSLILEFPGQKIAAIKAFRDRTDDGVGYRWRDGQGAEVCWVDRLKRAKEIIEIAQEVLDNGV